MRRVDKPAHSTPPSLVPPSQHKKDLSKHIMAKAETTQTRRGELLVIQKYLDQKNFNSRYKLSDIKDCLKNLYHGKCAWCESSVAATGWQVEHYRPKALYYWLAFSWDNLLCSCGSCNSAKGNGFEVSGRRETEPPEETQYVAQVNTLAPIYQKTERPLLIHPELEDPAPFFEWSVRGEIVSSDPRGTYTIKTCNLSRLDLCDSRLRVLNDFKDRLESVILENAGSEHTQAVINHEVNQFIREGKDPSNAYQSFRLYAARALLPGLIKSYVSTTPAKLSG